MHAFEPIPANFALLEQNIALNQGARVHAVRAALGAEPGYATFGRGPTERDSAEEMSAFFTLGGVHRQVEAPSSASTTTSMSTPLIAFGLRR